MDRLIAGNIRFSLILFCLAAFLCVPLFAQTHVSVPLDDPIYYILEQAQLKGLCTPLSGIKPYTQSVVVSAVKEILNSENTRGLNSTEREILTQYLDKYSKPEKGLDWQRGAYHAETFIGKNDTPLTFNLGGNLEMEGSSGIYPSFGENYIGTET